MAGVKGKDVLISVDDGSGTMVEVEYQGDATYNSGKSQNVVRAKNGSLPYQSEEGATLTFTFSKVRPLSTGQNRLYTLSDSNAAAEVEYNDPASGGHKVAGKANVTISEETANTEGIISVNVSMAFVDDPVRTVNP